jgi:hypothetical protein
MKEAVPSLVLGLLRSVLPPETRALATLDADLIGDLALDSLQFLETEAGLDLMSGDVDVTAIKTARDIANLLL